MYGKVTDKIDVYAFGVVLLELLSGRKPISNEYPKGEESLVMWAKPILSSGKFRHLLDKSLGYNYDADQMERMALASTLCIRRVPLARPHMSSINGDCDAVHEALFQVTTCLRNHYFRYAFPAFQDHGPPFPFMGRRKLSPSGRYSLQGGNFHHQEDSRSNPTNGGTPTPGSAVPVSKELKGLRYILK